MINHCRTDVLPVGKRGLNRSSVNDSLDRPVLIRECVSRDCIGISERECWAIEVIWGTAPQIQIGALWLVLGWGVTSSGPLSPERD